MTPEIASPIKTILGTLPDGAELRFYWQDGAQHLHMRLPGQQGDTQPNRVPDRAGLTNPQGKCRGCQRRQRKSGSSS